MRFIRVSLGAKTNGEKTMRSATKRLSERVPIGIRCLFAVLILLAPLFITACSIKERTDPIAPVFLDGAPLEESIAELPFKHSWLAQPNSPQSFPSLYVKPVRTDLLPKDEWTKSRGLAVSSSEEFDKSVAVLARYFRIRLLGELKKIDKPRFIVVEKPDASSLIMEIALTEVVLSEPIIRAAALAAPVPGVDVALSAISDPHVAFAARFTSPDGSRLVATAADRRFPPLRIIDLNKLRATSSAREIISQWSRELAQAIQFDQFTKVKKSWGFSLLPW